MVHLLHTDLNLSLPLQGLDPAQVEYRRRIWYTYLGPVNPFTYLTTQVVSLPCRPVVRPGTRTTQFNPG
jgi:hypothetical protein